MENEHARVEIKQEGDVMILELLDHEILDEITINDIADTLFAVVAENNPVKMVLSFAQVKHLSSMALGTLAQSAGVISSMLTRTILPHWSWPVAHLPSGQRCMLAF